jgi:hypothetical protein
LREFKSDVFTKPFQGFFSDFFALYPSLKGPILGKKGGYFKERTLYFIDSIGKFYRRKSYANIKGH